MRTLLVFLVLGALLWTAWFVGYRGFTRRWRAALAAEMHQRGLDITVGKITLDPFKGLVAEDVRLHLLNDRHTRVLSISQVALDINLADLLQKKANFLNAVELRDAKLKLPLDPADPDGPKLRVNRLRAKLLFPPGQVQLAQAEGEVHGIRVRFTGTLLHPELLAQAAGKSRTRTRDPAGVIARRRARNRALLGALDRLRFDRENPPRLELRFSGDLAKPLTSADPDAFRASADLRGRDLQFRGEGPGKTPYRLVELHVAGDYAAGMVHLPQIEITDTRGGRLSAQGEYRPGLPSADADSELKVQVESDLDLLAAARELLPADMLPTWTREITAPGSPRLRLNGRARLRPTAQQAGGATAVAIDPKTAQDPTLRTTTNAAIPDAPPSRLAELQITGHLGLGRTTWRGATCESLETDYSWHDGQWFLRDARLTTKPGQSQPLRADLLNADGRLRTRISGPLDLQTLAPLLPPRGRTALAEWQFTESPRIDVEVTGPGGSSGSTGAVDLATLQASGKIALGKTRFRGIPMNRLQVDFTHGGGVLTGKNLRLDRDEGSATADTFSYDFNRHEARIDNLRANVWPVEVAPWIDSDLARDLKPYRFNKPPNTVTNGLVQFFPGAKGSRLVIDANAPAGMRYTFVRKELNFANLSAQVVFTDDRLKIDNIRGDWFGGAMGGSVDLGLGKANDHRYTATLSANDVDFQKLTKLFFDYDESQGKLEATYRWSGHSDDARAMRGAGSVKVTQGNVFAIPVFGPLSGILNAILPGVGKNVAHQATADFLINGGKIYNGNLVVKGTGFSMLGGGWLGFTDDTMNFRMRVAPQGPVGTLLYPVSKLFEYNSQGSLNKPTWRPVVLNAPAPPAASSATAAPGQGKPAAPAPAASNRRAAKPAPPPGRDAPPVQP